MAYTILTIAGSLRKESFSLKIANALAKLAPASLKLDVTTLQEISFFNQDLEAAPPADWLAFREKLQKSNGVLFVTPEYNRSIPGGLKNAIDWASRPYGKNSFARKPSAVIGTSPGAIGTAIAQQSLRSVLSFCNSPQMNALEAYIQFSPGMITDDGDVTVESTREFLRNYMTAFAGFIARVMQVLPRDA